MSENKNLEKWYFFLCPDCLTLLETWEERYWCVEYATVGINKKTGEYSDVDVSHEDYEFKETICPECGWSSDWRSDAFIIAITNRLEIIPVGDYWKSEEYVLEDERNKIIDQFLNMKKRFDVINIR